MGLAFTMTCVGSSLADAQARNGFDGQPISAPAKATAECSAIGFLVGITEQQTDRLIGLEYSCVKAKSDQEWDVNSRVQRLGPGDLRHGTPMTKSCPTDWYLVGLEATTGSYSADTHGAAKPQLHRMIADLSLVCRNRKGDIFTAAGNHLTQAEDNDLRQIAWDGLGSARSCQAGYGAVKLSFDYDARRDIDPANRFNDVALTCKRLPVQIGPIATPRKP